MNSSDPEAWLGGRLPVLSESDLTAAQKALRDRMRTTLGHWGDEVGFRSETSAGRPIGPFNPMLRSPDIAQTFLQLQLDEAKHTDLSERVREIVILSVGSVWKAPYELYAHSAAARHAGLSEACVNALEVGVPSPELAVEERIAQRLALALAAGHMVDDDLYAEALRQFGEKGLVDFAVLAGCYHLVCGMLNLFAVPAP